MFLSDNGRTKRFLATAEGHVGPSFSHSSVVGKRITNHCLLLAAHLANVPITSLASIDCFRVDVFTTTDITSMALSIATSHLMPFGTFEFGFLGCIGLGNFHRSFPS